MNQTIILFSNGTWITHQDNLTLIQAQALYKNDPITSVIADVSNLKQVLMELGNRLVTEKGYHNSNQMAAQRALVGVGQYHTTAIAAFTEWLNRSTEAQQVLKEMGFAWPTSQRPQDANTE